MKRNTRTAIALIAILALVVSMMAGCGKNSSDSAATPTPTPAVLEPTATPTPTEVPATPTPTPNPLDDMTLKQVYADDFKVGVALPINMLSTPNLKSDIAANFNSMTFENETKPDAILNRDACVKGLPETYTEPVIHIEHIEGSMRIAKENGIAVRFHTLLWYQQTPSWFFTEDYTAKGAKVSREVMLKRMESYIKQVMEYMEEHYPGQVYCYDVVNEAINPGEGDPNGMRVKSLWYEVVGPDFMNYAFEYARKYAPEGVDLYYNDYNCYDKVSQILTVLQPILDAGNIDGIGMQCHLTISNSVERQVKKTAEKFTAAGYKVQITELDIGIEDESDANIELQAMKYRVLFKKIREAKAAGTIDIDCITIWGLYDAASWRADEYPLLYKYKGGKLVKKRAWYGAMQDPTVKAIEL